MRWMLDAVTEGLGVAVAGVKRWEGEMAQTVAGHLLARLRQWDVEQVFAYPGDGINGIVAASGGADNKPRFVQAHKK